MDSNSLIPLKLNRRILYEQILSPQSCAVLPVFFFCKAFVLATALSDLLELIPALKIAQYICLKVGCSFPVGLIHAGFH